MTEAERIYASRLISDQAREQANPVLSGLARARLDMVAEAEAVARRLVHSDQCHAVYMALLDVRKALGGKDVTGNGWEVVNEHVKRAELAWRVAEAVAAMDRGEALCSDCGVSAEHEDLRALSGVSRGLHCEACAMAAEREEF